MVPTPRRSSRRGSGSRTSAPSPSRTRKCAEPCRSSRLALLPAGAAAQSSQFGVRGLGHAGPAAQRAHFSLGGAFGMFDASVRPQPGRAGQRRRADRPVHRRSRTSGTSRTRRAPRRCARPAFPTSSIAGPVRQAPAVARHQLLQLHQPRLHAGEQPTPSILRGVLVPVQRHLLLARRPERPALRRRLSLRRRLDRRWLASTSSPAPTACGPSGVRRHDLPGRHPELRAVVRRGRVRRRRDPEVRAGIQRRGHGPVRRARATSIAIRPGSARWTCRIPSGSGIRWRPQPKLELGEPTCSCGPGPAPTATCWRSGGTGAENTVRGVAGRRVHVGPSPADPSARSASAPATGRCRFRWCPASSPASSASRIGTGMRFAQERAGIDLGLEHVWRSAGAYSERAFLLTSE